jgi:hypothetical protein
VIVPLILLVLLGLLCGWLWKKGVYGRWSAVTLACVVVGYILVSFLQGLASSKRDEALRTSLDSKLHAALVVGDSRDKIEQVLAENGLKYDPKYAFDPYLGYVSDVPIEGGPNTRLTIEISLDQAKKLQTIKVYLHGSLSSP